MSPLIDESSGKLFPEACREKTINISRLTNGARTRVSADIVKKVMGIQGRYE